MILKPLPLENRTELEQIFGANGAQVNEVELKQGVKYRHTTRNVDLTSRSHPAAPLGSVQARVVSFLTTLWRDCHVRPPTKLSGASNGLRVLVIAVRGDNPLLRSLRVLNEDDIFVHFLNVTTTGKQHVGAAWWSIYLLSIELLINHGYFHKVHSESCDLLLVLHC